MTDRVAGLLLAAGGGARLGRPKALVEVGGRLLIDLAVGLMAAAELNPRVVVLGAAADEVRSVADLSDVDVVHNPDWEAGMAASLRLGLAALADRADAVVVVLVDQPLIGVEAVERLADAWRRGATAAVATYDGQPRNPVLFDVGLWPAIIRSADGDVGARAFLRAHPDVVTEVPCDDTGTADDIDTPDDLARIESRLDTDR